MTLRFGEFLLDRDARQLLRDGKEARLSPKAFDLLVLLLEKRPDVVAKSDLLAAIWPDTFVVEANLNVVVGEIRRALADDRHSPRFIRTVHGIGYAFSGQATDVDEDAVSGSAAVRPGSAPSARCWLAWEQKVYPLVTGENVIGRDPRSDVWLDDTSVSRRHARIRVANDLARLEDLESTNGTFIGDEQLASPKPLQDGDVVVIGSVRLTFRTWSDKAARTRRLRRTDKK